MRAAYCLERSGAVARLARRGRFVTYGRVLEFPSDFAPRRATRNHEADPDGAGLVRE
jgi:hypothetical protein